MIKHAFATPLSAWFVREHERKGQWVESDRPGSGGLYLAHSELSVNVCRTKGAVNGAEEEPVSTGQAWVQFPKEAPRGRTALACLCLGETVAAVALDTCRSANPLLWCQKVSEW